MKRFPFNSGWILLVILFLFAWSSAYAGAPLPKDCQHPVSANDPIWSKLVSQDQQVWKSDGHTTEMKIKQVSPTAPIAELDLESLDCADTKAMGLPSSPAACTLVQKYLAKSPLQVQGLLCKIDGSPDSVRFWPVDATMKPQSNPKIPFLGKAIELKANSDNGLGVVFDGGGEIDATASVQ